MGFWEAGDMNTLSAIFADAAPILGGPLVISLLSLAILIGWEKLASGGVTLFHS